MWSDYYNKTSALSSADPNTIATVLSNKGIISKRHRSRTRISLASTQSQKATLVAIIEHQMQSLPGEKNFNFLHALSEENLSLPDDVVELL